MLELLKQKRAKSPAARESVEAPVLTEADEDFLQRIASEGSPPDLPERPPPLPARPQTERLPEAGNPEGNNAQIALLGGAQRIALPETPDVPESIDEPSFAPEIPNADREKEHVKNRKSKWSWIRRDSRDAKRKATATGLMSAAEGLKTPDAVPNEDHIVSDPEAQREEAEMSDVLEQLNLAAVNNRVFSLSKESQELLQKFTLVLKDLTNGVPTAYSDLESLLTNSEDQIQRSYSHLPDWLQKLVEQLPSKMTKSIGPEVLAASAEKHGVNAKYANMAAKGAEKAGVKFRVPSLKDLVTKPGAVAALLKTILNFLKLRFPAFLGMNVLYSLALFVLLFVCWYCHKRGREVRLENERLLTEGEIEKLGESRFEVTSPDDTPGPPSQRSTLEDDVFGQQSTKAGSSHQHRGEIRSSDEVVN